MIEKNNLINRLKNDKEKYIKDEYWILNDKTI